MIPKRSLSSFVLPVVPLLALASVAGAEPADTSTRIIATGGAAGEAWVLTTDASGAVVSHVRGVDAPFAGTATYGFSGTEGGTATGTAANVDVDGTQQEKKKKTVRPHEIDGLQHDGTDAQGSYADVGSADTVGSGDTAQR